MKILQRMSKKQKAEIFFENQYQVKYHLETLNDPESVFKSNPISLPMLQTTGIFFARHLSSIKHPRLSSVLPMQKERRRTSKKRTVKASFVNYISAVQLLNQEEEDENNRPELVDFKNLYKRIIVSLLIN